MFLYSSSASFGSVGAFGALDCAHAPAIASKKLKDVPHTASHNFKRFAFTTLTLADKLTSPRAQRLQDTMEFLESGVDFAALGERCDAVRGAEGQRLDGHGGLAAPGRHQAAAIAEEKILDVMRAVVRIDYRGLRIIPHAACPEKVEAHLLFPRREAPLFRGARRVKDLACARDQPVCELQIIGMILVRQSQGRQAPCVLQIRV